MRIVVALGGNALLRRGEAPSIEAQRHNVRLAAGALARMAKAHVLAVTHGNGPQVGLLAEQSESVPDIERAPLDVLGAQTQGMIGYLIEDELRDALGEGREVATLLTQVVVDAGDSAFDRPTKPVGPVYDEASASRIAAERGWTVAADGDYWRRVVPSPEPLRILEVGAVRLLLDAGVVVICAGGGGIPVVENAAGGWRGVEAVIDKDYSAALLAQQLEADVLMLLTDVTAVCDDWGTAHASPIRTATPEAIRERSFAPGSMAPKVEAACRFVRSSAGAGGRVAYIGALDDAMSILREQAGTRIAN